MNDKEFVNEVRRKLRDNGYMLISGDFIDKLITTLHANVTTINTMTEIAEIETKLQDISAHQPTDRQVNSLKELSQRISEIAFNVEDVRHDQQA
ncbi:hypothetical protein [Psychrobacter sp. S1-30-MNA-CIBAN-0213]|uniref:hypothetical protein n=1 Tax=Psychrobacter sp. S1-30-MNA-CIBAN-0213 TaxID=3140456 RepID=UPI003332A4AE